MSVEILAFIQTLSSEALSLSRARARAQSHTHKHTGARARRHARIQCGKTGDPYVGVFPQHLPKYLLPYPCDSFSPLDDILPWDFSAGTARFLAPPPPLPPPPPRSHCLEPPSRVPSPSPTRLSSSPGVAEVTRRSGVLGTDMALLLLCRKIGGWAGSS